MNTLIDQIVAVLAGQQTIEGLPNNKLVAYDQEKVNGTILSDQIGRGFFLKIARLQTLAAQEQDNSKMPSFEETQSRADALGIDFSNAKASSLAVQYDSTRNIIMIESLIILMVRKEFPNEVNVFDSRYIAVLSGAIYRCPMPKMRFSG